MRKHRAPALSAFNKPWQWRFEPNGKNRGVSSLLPLSSVNSDAGFLVNPEGFNPPQPSIPAHSHGTATSNSIPKGWAFEPLWRQVDDVLVLQLWVRPLGAAESRCLPPGQETGLPRADVLQPAARRYFHSKLLLSAWCSPADEVASLLTQLAPSSASNDAGWADERHRCAVLRCATLRCTALCCAALR